VGMIAESKIPMFILPTDDEKVKVFIFNAGFIRKK